MEEIDPSNFSGLGKTFFSEIISSEAAMRNLNTEEEKKSKIEHENQEINKNQGNNEKSNIRSESNSLESEIGLEIGGDEKIGMKTATQEIGILETEQISNSKALAKEVPELASISSGLDDSEKAKKEKSENKNSNKTGPMPANLPSGIPKYSNQLSQVISSTSTTGKGKEGKEIAILTQVLDSNTEKKKMEPNTILSTPALTQVNGKEGKETPAMALVLEPSKISLTIPGSSNSKISSISLLTRPGNGKAGKEIPALGQEPEINGEKRKVNPPINPRNPGSGKFTSRLSLTSDQLAKWEESQTKGEKYPNLGPQNMKAADIDKAAQRVVDRIRASSSHTEPSLESGSQYYILIDQ